MKRREVLASTGVAIATSGCMGLLAAKCEPGEDELGRMYDELDPDRNAEVSIRGVVVKFTDTSGLMVVSDGTGLAEVAPPGWKEFNEDWFQRGECVEVSGMVLANPSRRSGRIHINTGLEEDIESVGDAKREPPTIPDKPNATFELDYRPAEEVAIVSHTEGESIPARQLEVRRLHNEEISTYPWHELTEKAPDDEVSVGDSLRFEKTGHSNLMWRYNEYWTKEMGAGWSF